MISILQSLSRTVHYSLAIALILFLGLHFGGDGFAFDRSFFSWLFRYLHVLSGIMWIGLLWYFNFVQIPSMPNIPDEQKPAIGKVIAPKALFWFLHCVVWVFCYTICFCWFSCFLGSGIYFWPSEWPLSLRVTTS